MLYPHSSSNFTHKLIFYTFSSLSPDSKKLTRIASYCLRYFGAIVLAKEAMH